MKTSTFLKKATYFALPVIAFGALFLSSCKKDDNVDPNQSTSIRIVNSAEGSAAQDLYVNGSKVNTSAVAYGEASGYSKVKTGESKGEFRSAGSATVNASVDMNLDANKYYSVYYATDASASTSLLVEDDMTAPAANKAKVRFIHLSKAAANGVDVAITGAAKFINNLAFRARSAYNEVDANTTFLLYTSGSTTVGLNIPTTVQAGKIYTIVISGSTTATLKYTVLVQN